MAVNKVDIRESLNKSVDEVEQMFMKFANANPELELGDFELTVSCFGQYLAQVRKLIQQHVRD